MAYVITARWRIRPGEVPRVLAVLGALAAASRDEPGNVLYQVHTDPLDPLVVFMYEQYVDEQAFQAHVASEHFRTLCLDEAVPLLDERERAFYTTWESTQSKGGATSVA